MSEAETVTLTDFLLARIAEDEAIARVPTQKRGIIPSCDADESGHWTMVEHPYDGIWPLPGTETDHPPTETEYPSREPWAVHAQRHDPARVLAECAAKRAIVEQVSQVEWAGYAVRDFVLGQLAAFYSDHPDYRNEWAA